ncbi:hypothetical protein BAY61_32375 (plasmid) [Prauserella marina]|uniref:Uncharacterized protein n=1 Tax=Prauserella marina TaxID=530584 RepID=A0A222W195_9PSEU|nr:hypothetical protein [Prauserella marina]ASR39978.1 hypothetical protein BAY61_32375 [Prauserella marina]PWV71317.1 hypothetical protein DES30_11233 [Prauserella marina]SDD96668.1 hypothetical protein SAMN05421630_11579 [Prauserella marina]
MGYDMVVQGAPEEEESTYLRRSIWGMGPTVEALVSLGMAFWSDVPDFPESDHLSGDDFNDGDPVTERAKVYVQAVERTLADHGVGDADHIGGIPAHKFSSNDGWHVTDKECLEALNAYEVSIQAGDSHPEALHDDVIPFLRTAAKYEGFRVL